MNHIKGLDTLRAFAVFFVLTAHFGYWFDNNMPPGKFISNVLIPDGSFGVFLFFVLSGFLITSILLNAKTQGKEKNQIHTAKIFFIRRALRIFPIYYLLLFFLFQINYTDVQPNIVYFETYTSNLLIYKTNTWNAFSHTWTLSIEEQFYLIWPWFILFIKEQYLKYLFIGAIIIGLVTTYIDMGIYGHMDPFQVYNCFDAFAIGGVYAWARLDHKRCKRVEKGIMIAAILALIIYFYCRVLYFFGHPPDVGYLTKTICSTISVWLIVLIVNNKSKWLRKYFLENRFLNFIGRISYGIYLYHYVYLHWVNDVGNWLNRVTMGQPEINKIVMERCYNYWIHVTIVILISTISYYLIEKPILRLKKFFNYKKQGVTPASV